MSDKTHPSWKSEHAKRLGTPKSAWVRVGSHQSSQEAHEARKKARAK
jgi:hypothetical protein